MKANTPSRFECSVLVVDDHIDRSDLVTIRRLLQRELRLPVVGFATVEEALKWLRLNQRRPCVTVVDYFLGGSWTGDQATAVIKQRFPGVGVVVATGHNPRSAGEDVIRKAAAAGAHGFVRKDEAGALVTQVRRAMEEVVLRKLDRVLHGTKGLGGHWSAILDAALAITGATIGQIMQYDRPHEELVVRASRATPEKYRRLRLRTTTLAGPVDRSISRLVVLEGRTVSIPDLREETTYELDYRQLIEETRASLTVPIRRRDRPRDIVGVINLESDESGRFDSHMEYLLEHDLADRAAMGLHNAHERQRLRALYEAGRRVTESIDLDTVLASILRAGCELAGAEYGGILLRAEGEDVLELAQTWPKKVSGTQLVQPGHPFPFHSDFRGFNDDGIVGVIARAARTLTSQLVPDTSLDPDYVPCLDSMRSELVVPIVWDQRLLLGALNLESTRLDAFSKADQDHVEALANQAAAAINNAQRYRELESVREIVDLQFAVMGISAATAVVLHAMQKRLSNLETGIAWLQGEFAGSEHAAVPTPKILNTLARLRVELDDLKIGLDQDPGLVDPSKTESVPINDFVSAILSRFRQKAMERVSALQLEFSTSVDPSVTVRVSRHWLDHALTNVLDNTMNAFQRAINEPAILTVRMSLDRDTVLLEVRDNGSGIPDEVLDQIGKVPIRKKQGEEGQGVGLLLSRYILLSYGGDLSPEQGTLDGAHINITIPAEVHT